MTLQLMGWGFIKLEVVLPPDVPVHVIIFTMTLQSQFDSRIYSPFHSFIKGKIFIIDAPTILGEKLVVV
jgi:hypothetical protein